MTRWHILPFTFLSICLPLAGAAQQKDAAPPKPKVTVVAAAMKSVARSETFSGRIQAVDRVDIVARVPGFIDKIGFQDGKRVSTGEVLIEIEKDTYEAAITQIQGQIESAQAEKKLADIEVERQEKLLKTGDVAESVVQKAQAQQGKVDGQLLQLQGSLQNAQLNLSYTKITAPFDGRVGLTTISPGAFVGPDSGALLSLSSVDPINVVFPVAEAIVLDFREDDKPDGGVRSLTLQMTMANGNRYDSNGKIDVVDTSVQSGTDSILVRGVFPNPDGLLVDGQLVRVGVIEEAEKPSIVIPVQALQKDQGGFFTLVVGGDGKVVKRPVKMARVAGTEAVIAEGLDAGDRVITEGAQKVRVGMEVDAAPPEGGTPQQATGNSASAASEQ